MPLVHHRDIAQGVCTAPRVPWAPLIIHTPPPATAALLTRSALLPLSECRRPARIRAASSDRRPPRTRTHAGRPVSLWRGILLSGRAVVCSSVAYRRHLGGSRAWALARKATVHIHARVAMRTCGLTPSGRSRGAAAGSHARGRPGSPDCLPEGPRAAGPPRRASAGCRRSVSVFLQYITRFPHIFTFIGIKSPAASLFCLF